MLSCPHCRSDLEEGNGVCLTCACGQAFARLPSGGWDFLGGAHFPDFRFDPDNAAQRELLAQEAAGVSWRTESFILPLIRRYRSAAGEPQDSIRVLDCGCGSGVAVDILRAHGVDASGIDAGGARRAQWAGKACGPSLHSANALHLPFRAGSLDAVLSSGLVEHIGIHEEEASRYRSVRLPDCTAQRERFVSELVRVLKPRGFILLDHPNGSFPADFWHGGAAGSVRWHISRRDMLPRPDEIRSYFRIVAPGFRLLPLSPIHRLRFNQVSAHWYGRFLSPVAKSWLRFMDRPGFRFLAASCLNPYLVTLATRDPNPEQWVYRYR